MIEMKLMSTYFDKIKLGKKIYEVRLNDEKRKNIKIGDTIKFVEQSNPNNAIQTVVEETLHYNSFEEMSNNIDGKMLGFDNKNIAEIVNIYHSIYTKEDENKYGVVAFKLQLL